MKRTKEPFAPAVPDHLTMYFCGRTIYSFAHIGNAPPAVVFDVFFRLPKRRFGRVDYARNVTDVDDKGNVAAKEAGQAISFVAERYIGAYHADMASFGVLIPDLDPRVTEHIAEFIGTVERLMRGVTPMRSRRMSCFTCLHFRLTGPCLAAIETR